MGPDLEPDDDDVTVVVVISAFSVFAVDGVLVGDSLWDGVLVLVFGFVTLPVKEEV